MNELNGFKITKRDRLLRAWQVSSGLVREYQEYARETEKEDSVVSKLFSSLAEKESHISAELLSLLQSL